MAGEGGNIHAPMLAAEFTPGLPVASAESPAGQGSYSGLFPARSQLHRSQDRKYKP
jgi:hypothetical protein